MICLLLPPHRSQAGQEKCVCWGSNSFLQSHMGLRLKALICCRSDGAELCRGAVIAGGLRLPLSVRLWRARPLLRDAFNSPAPGKQPVGQPETHWFTRGMGINRANPTPEVVSHWACVEVTGIRTAALTAATPRRRGNRRAENQQSMSCKVSPGSRLRQCGIILIENIFILKVQCVKFALIYGFTLGIAKHSAHKYINQSVHLQYNESQLVCLPLEQFLHNIIYTEPVLASDL